MEPADVSRALRADFWPKLKAAGFGVRTDRVAWRYTEDAVDVVELWAVGPNADACGCTSVSLSAAVGSIPAFLPPPPGSVMKGGRARPRYYQCELHVSLHKTLLQPWFRPFSRAPSPSTPRSFLEHRLGLQAVLRSDVHDRSDIWFVKDDGSNLGEVVADLWQVTSAVGLPALARMHDPCQVIDMIQAGALLPDPDSPAGQEIVEAARRACP